MKAFRPPCGTRWAATEWGGGRMSNTRPTLSTSASLATKWISKICRQACRLHQLPLPSARVARKNWAMWSRAGPQERWPYASSRALAGCPHLACALFLVHFRMNTIVDASPDVSIIRFRWPTRRVQGTVSPCRCCLGDTSPRTRPCPRCRFMRNTTTPMASRWCTTRWRSMRLISCVSAWRGPSPRSL